MADLAYLSIGQAHELLQTKQVACVELVSYYIDRIEKYDKQIHAVLTLCKEQALRAAQKVDDKIAKGETIGLLEGIPYTAKDMFLTSKVQTTAASQILKGYTPPYSATVIEKLNQAGAILLAKTNQDEFAHGGSTENSSFQKTTNPWDITKVPGGSSGGSAAAVAADFGIFSLGTDTGGSIREPASFCGITGYKPTYGLVSRYGVVAMASSFDCIGPLARSAEDATIILEAMAGRDFKDATTIESNLATKAYKPENNLKIGVVKEYASQTNIVDAIEVFKQQGYTINDVELPDGNMALAAYYVLVPSEISSNLERYDGVRYGQVATATNVLDSYTKSRGKYLGDEPKRRILTGTYALSAGYYDAYYKKAMQVRTLIHQQFEELFKGCDIIISPTTINPAFGFNAKSDPIEMYKTDILTVTANLAGIPAISIPSGLDVSTGLPLGMQIIGRQGDDARVLAIAQTYQQNTDWHKRVTLLENKL